MKRVSVLLMVLLLTLVYITPVNSIRAGSEISVDTASMRSGIIRVSGLNEENKRLKLRVEKEDRRYVYNLRNDGYYESFPLQMGDGEYKISVLENVEGDNYTFVSITNINVEMENQTEVYLGSVQNVRWDDTSAAVKKARELTKGIDDDAEKVSIIYDFITANMTYDYDKLDKLTYDYLPDIEGFLESRKGICYDYASLFAAMLRSIQIPAKLVKGYADGVNGYHAWNEVYIASTGNWILIDTTYDSLIKAPDNSNMIKDSNLYSKINEY